MVSEECKTLYNKLNTFVKKVINRDVQPQIDSLNSSPTNTSREILANSDLNDYTDNGFYYCNLSNSEIATISNCPSPRGFSMFVEKNYTYNETGIKQVVTDHEDGTTYIRTFYTDFSNVFHDSGWKPLYYDTGWKTITNASGFSTYDSNGSPTRYRRIGKIVHIEGIFKNSSKLASGSSTTMGTISDTSCRPQKDQYALMQGSGKSFFLLKVQTNGQIHIERYGSTANQETGVNSWLHCFITYFVE